MSPEERKRVEAVVRPAKAEKRVVLRAEAALLMSQGVSTRDTAKALGVNDRTVRRWRQSFLQTGDILAALADAPRSGRPRSLSRTRTLRESRQRHANHRRTSGSR
jgi:transposase